VLKTVAANLLSGGAAQLPVGWLRPLAGVQLVVPYYHMVSDVPVPHVSHLYRFRSTAEFQADVEYLLRHFEPVSLADIVDAVKGRRTLDRPCFHLTFDDGFREMHEIVAPILQRAGAPATFFLNTRFLDGGGLAHHNELSVLLDRMAAGGSNVSPATLRRLESLLPPAENGDHTMKARMLSLRYSQKAVVRSLAEVLAVDLGQYVLKTQPYLTSEQVEDMLRKGFQIGGHSHDHPFYADLPLEQQLAQTRTSMQLLHAHFGMSLRAFAFPHNDDGVGEEFFAAAVAEGLFDVSFGTGGLVRHFHGQNIERVRMEKTSAPAGQILARQFVRGTYFRILGHVIGRPAMGRSQSSRSVADRSDEAVRQDVLGN
jgi:peptidoglycan/xylan/chitin deacetylase (PgdA/CDA1 family)